ncbi:MAG: 50S ribosomal protein L24e [Nitrososphaerales archaeon]
MFAQKKCSFCGKDVTLGYGLMLVRNDGSIYWYCSSKCRKNSLKLRRDPRKLKWTTFYKKGKG